jgi:hypothetical protein
MAYGLIIAAVRPEALSALKIKIGQTSMKDDPSPPFMEAEKIVVTSHYYLSAGTGDTALDAALADLFEAGETIDAVFRHPYRPPLYQDNDVIRPKIPVFKKAYKAMLANVSEHLVESWNLEFAAMLEMVDFLDEQGYGMVTFLDKPFDKERAESVHYPVEFNSEEPY